MSYENLKQPSISRINEIIADKSKYEPEYLEYMVRKSVEDIYSQTINYQKIIRYYENWLIFLKEQKNKSFRIVFNNLPKNKKKEFQNIFKELFKRKDFKFISTIEMQIIVEDKIEQLKKKLVQKNTEIRENNEYKLLFEYINK